MLHRSVFIVLALASLIWLPAAARAASVTNSGDDGRTGWYPDAGLSPQTVGDGSFGRLWTTEVDGQVYAQPLLHEGTLLVATERNRVYGLDPATGAARWTRADLGAPFDPRSVSCGDLTPDVGITSTPVIDPATDTAYVLSKTADGGPRWLLHALDVATGAERPNFPVAIAGTAQNAPGQTFDPRFHLNRPGLLLMDGVVYAGFGSHCDHGSWQGWVFGVATTGAIRARWVAVGSGEGAGIWQSGSGLMSDGPGRIIVGTGNPGAPPNVPIPGERPPATLGESIVRLQVQGDGSLAAADFFSPYDAQFLDTWDADFASGGPVALPDAQFGTTATPHLAVAVGKQGYVYLLDRDRLGGHRMGPNASDDVVQRLGPYGGVWSRPGVWPGDGGYVYIPTASGGNTAGGSSGRLRVYRYGRSGDGRPTLSLAGTSADAFGFSSSAPVITSHGTTSGSALVWTIRASGGSGVGAELRAYDPVPVGERPVLRWSAPIGTSSKFAMPGAGGGRIYVPTRDGRVIGFGSPVAAPLTGAQLTFPTTTTGERSARTLTLTATDAVTVTSLRSDSPQYALGAPSRALPATLAAGDRLTVPVTFAPTQTGIVSGTLTAATSRGDHSFSLSGTGRAAGPVLEATPPAVSFGGADPGAHRSDTVVLRNVGGAPLRVQAVERPDAPFALRGAPAPGAVIDPGEGVTITVAFDPTAPGYFEDELVVRSDGGTQAIGVSGTVGDAGRVAITGQELDFGAVAVGARAERTFTLQNAGRTPVAITRSKPPVSGAFSAVAELPEGTTLAPGESRAVSVAFAPGEVGVQETTWSLNADDGLGVRAIRLSGQGVPPGGGEPLPAGTPPPVRRPRVGVVLRRRVGRTLLALRVGGTCGERWTASVRATRGGRPVRAIVRVGFSADGRRAVDDRRPFSRRGTRLGSRRHVVVARVHTRRPGRGTRVTRLVLRVPACRG